MNELGTVFLDCRSCAAIGLLIPKHDPGLTPNGHAVQVPVMENQGLNIMPLLTEKSRFICKTSILTAGLLIVCVKDEDFHRES